MLTKREQANRLSLQERKPLAFAKILKFPERIKNKESVALIQLQYNYACNFKCKHCAIEKFKQDKKSMSVVDVKRIADQADALGLASICISGGEPLLFPDLLQVINAIGPKRFVISVDTNGFFLTEEKIKWLVSVGVDRIHLSIDGLESNHNMFRGVDSWKRCIEALDYCKQYGLGVIINIVATKKLINSGELIKQLEFIKSFDQHASIIYAKPVGAFEDSKDEILDTKDLEYIQSLTQKYDISTHLSVNCGHEFGCLCIKRHFSITAYGDVLPCPWIPITIGNIMEENLETIIKRGLSIPWFSYDHKFSCQSGNKDTFFYQNILPQIKNLEYPADWRKIDWKGEFPRNPYLLGISRRLEKNRLERGKMILLTGSTGMIGRNIKEVLPDLLCPTHEELDLTDKKKVDEYLNALRPEKIIHCASNDDEICLKDNLQMFLNLAESRIPMVTFCTGREVENRVSHATGEYILSKYITKELALCKYYHIAVIKIWGCFGKYEKSIRFFTGNIERIKQGLPILVTGDKLFSYVYVKDLVRIIKYHFLSHLTTIVGYTHSLLEYAKILKEISGSPYDIIVEKNDFLNSYVGKNKMEYLYTPIEDAIQEMWEEVSNGKII